MLVEPVVVLEVAEEVVVVEEAVLVEVLVKAVASVPVEVLEVVVLEA